jgi:hypothetical protein
MVLGVFYTPGWHAILTNSGASALVGVIATQAFNLRTKHIDAKTRDADRQAERETRDADRQHEREMAHQQRVWQAKSDALTRVISGCWLVKWQAQWTEDVDEIIRRAGTMTALDEFRNRIGGEDGISEVMAYAAEPVWPALKEVLELINVLRRDHGDEIEKLRPVATRIDAKTQQPDSGRVLRRALWSQERPALDDAIGHMSDFDVDKVIALCDKVIDAARKDLQGRPHTE